MKAHQEVLPEVPMPEPIVEPVEVFELPGEKLRREWAENGCDWSWQILRFLQGRRVNEVSAQEIKGTEFYARCTEAEKQSLLFVAGQASQPRELNAADAEALAARSEFLLSAVEGRALGHRNWLNELLAIPSVVAAREAYDQKMFPRTYKSARLFSWIFGERSQSSEVLDGK